MPPNPMPPLCCYPSVLLPLSDCLSSLITYTIAHDSCHRSSLIHSLIAILSEEEEAQLMATVNSVLEVGRRRGKQLPTSDPFEGDPPSSKPLISPLTPFFLTNLSGLVADLSF